MNNEVVRFFLHNWPIKLLSLTVAFIMWITVINDRPLSLTQTIEVPVQYLNQADQTVLEEEALTVKVDITSWRKSYNKTDLKDVVAQVDLKGLTNGEYRVKPVILNLPAEYHLEGQSVESVRVGVYPLVEAERIISVVIEGVPTAGYEYKGFSVTPSAVVIEDSQNKVQAVDNVSVAINVTGKDKPLHLAVPIKLYDSMGRELHDVIYSPHEALVAVDIEPILEEKEVKIRLNRIGTLPEGYVVTGIQMPDMVKVHGEKDALAKLTEIVTDPVDLTGVSDNITLDVPLVLPDGITTDNATVKVSLSVQKDTATAPQE